MRPPASRVDDGFGHWFAGFIEVEIKTPTTYQSDSQREFERDVTAAGIEYMVARSSEDVAGLVECLR